MTSSAEWYNGIMGMKAAKADEPTDAQIIERVLLGERELFGALFDRYAKRLFGYLWHFAGRREDCEDFLQETFYRAYVNLKYCREREKFSSWLFSIGHNVAVSGAKRLSYVYAREVPGETLDGVFRLDDVASNEDLNLAFVRQENADSLKELMASMPPKFREVLVLFYYNDFSLKEISDVVGVPVNTIKTRLHRARAHVAENFKGNIPGIAARVASIRATSGYH